MRAGDAVTRGGARRPRADAPASCAAPVLEWRRRATHASRTLVATTGVLVALLIGARALIWFGVVSVHRTLARRAAGAAAERAAASARSSGWRSICWNGGVSRPAAISAADARVRRRWCAVVAGSLGRRGAPRDCSGPTSASLRTIASQLGVRSAALLAAPARGRDGSASRSGWCCSTPHVVWMAAAICARLPSCGERHGRPRASRSCVQRRQWPASRPPGRISRGAAPIPIGPLLVAVAGRRRSLRRSLLAPSWAGAPGVPGRAARAGVPGAAAAGDRDVSVDPRVCDRVQGAARSRPPSRRRSRSQREDLKLVRLPHALEAIDAMPSLAEFVTSSSEDAAPTTDRAFIVWSQTELATYRTTSAVELYGPNGRLVSRFALILPEYGTHQRSRRQLRRVGALRRGLAVRIERSGPCCAPAARSATTDAGSARSSCARCSTIDRCRSSRRRARTSNRCSADRARRRRKARSGMTSSSPSTAGAARRSTRRARACGRCPTRSSTGWWRRATRSGRP